MEIIAAAGYVGLGTCFASVVDARNQYEPKHIHKQRFNYLTLGRDATNG